MSEDSSKSEPTVWREAGEWWLDASPREVVQTRKPNGKLVETIHDLPPPDPLPFFNPPEPTKEDNREEWSVRIRKIRDEKVARACGVVGDHGFKSIVKPRGPVLLHLLSGYTFGRSSILAEEAPAHAAMHGYSSALLADRFSLAGVREFTATATKVGLKPLIGATIELDSGGEVVLIARNLRGYQSLSRLISECHLHEPRGYPLANWDRVMRHADGVTMLSGGNSGVLNQALAARKMDCAAETLNRMILLYGSQNCFIQIERSYLPWERRVNQALLDLADQFRVKAVAGGPVTHIERGHFPAQDVLVCIESLCEIEQIDGRKPNRHADQPQIIHPPRRSLNAERYLHDIQEQQDQFADRRELIANAQILDDQCEANVIPGMAPMPILTGNDEGSLREITYLGAAKRYRTMTRSQRTRIDLELERIERLRFGVHFLIAADMCDWARSQNILFSGRGSVVDCAVAYCLGISRIDAQEHNLHFDRFLPGDGSKRPDIDIDFEAARRNDVRNYLTHKYGKEHVATVAAFGAYRSRGIIREVGKVLGIPTEAIDHLTKRLHGSVTPDKLRQAIDSKPELRDSGISPARFEWVFRLADRLMDIPMGIRSHSSGIVISRDPITDYVPVMLSGDEDVRILQWDKRSAKRSFDKFDVLCLRGNDVLGGTQTRIRETIREFDVEGLPLDDPETYRTMRSGQLIGIPQSASPAMRQAHIRLRTENLKDASLVQAGIRPGVGGAVKINELIARRRGKPYAFNHPDLEQILGPTYGIIVFQEQVDRLLQTFGGYNGDEAETIRESIHKKRRENFALSIREQVIQHVVANGFTPALAEEVFELVAVFQGYGFAEGHALAFAEVSIRSVWCQQNYPAPYFAALLDAQPAGYYGPCTIANEARIRGVRILPPCVNRSGLGFQTEDVPSAMEPEMVIPDGGIRVAFRQISGISESLREAILFQRPFGSFFDFVARVRPARDELETLILCGALDALHPNRRTLLWAIPMAQNFAEDCNLSVDALPLLMPEPRLPADVTDFSAAERAIYERRILGLDVREHLMGFERNRVHERGGITAAEAGRQAPGTKIIVVGNPIRLRFPPTSSGKRVMFFDLEDETGLLNVTCFDETYRRDGHSIICSPYVTLRGVAQDRDGHIAFLAHRVYPYQPWLSSAVPENLQLPLVIADFLMS